jgi:hypothetical protein
LVAIVTTLMATPIFELVYGRQRPEELTTLKEGPSTSASCETADA